MYIWNVWVLIAFGIAHILSRINIYTIHIYVLAGILPRVCLLTCLPRCTLAPILYKQLHSLSSKRMRKIKYKKHTQTLQQ